MSFHIGVVGSRKCPPHWKQQLEETLSYAKAIAPDFTLVSGHSPGGGPDIWAENWADFFSQPKLIFPIEPGPSYEFRKRAMARNTEIVRHSDLVIALWDWDSSGTANSIAKAASLERSLIIITNPVSWLGMFDQIHYAYKKWAIKH